MILKAKERTRAELKDCLRILHIAHDVVSEIGWEEDFKLHIRDIFVIYREKLDEEKVLKRDVNNLKKYLECINTFDKSKIFKKGEKILA